MKRIWGLTAVLALFSAGVFLVIFLAACGERGETVTSTPLRTGVSPPDLSAYPWVYLRDGQPLAAEEAVVSVLAVGDVMLGRGVLVEPEPLADAGWLGIADVVLGNLEGVISSQQAAENSQQAADQTSRIVLTMPETAVSHLQNAGFDLLGLANNHSLDLGAAGLAETAVSLQQAGLTPIGVQTSAVITPTIRVVNGVRLAFFAFNTIRDPQGERCQLDGVAPCPVVWDAETAVPAIQQAKNEADAVIVFIHWGFEYEMRLAPGQERLAETVRAAGAAVVIGHHPHTAQPIVADADGLTAFSLGNFVFDQETAVTQNGLALLAYFDKAGLRAVQALPLEAGLKPRLLPLTAAELWLTVLLPPPPRLAFACTEVDCLPVAAPSTTESGQFYSGQIDLTGDGQPETVRKEGGRVTIYEGGTAVWQSPADWRVVDVALGDPNDDGRYEVILAIWRKDGAGYERSQPYIVGHRGGVYDLLWGGRPVADPIQELALADVDGDGIEELVVIIEQADGLAQVVAVWQWQGWSFSLQWQSQPGWYRDLVIVAGEEQLLRQRSMPALITVYQTEDRVQK